MAATDKHYRNQYTLDIVFGVSCAAMLLSTLWMFVQDYNRDFKTVQRKFRDVEATIAERDMIDRLPNLDQVKQQQRTLTKARETLAEKKEDLKAKSRELTAKRELADERYRTIKADYDAQASYYNIAVDDAGKFPEGSPQAADFKKQAEGIQNTLKKLDSELGVAKKALDDIDAQIEKEIKTPLKPYEDAVTKADEEMKKLTGNFDRFAKVAAQKAWGMSDSFRALPIIDGFESPTKIRQQWLPDLTIDYGGFKDVPRYDRCTTCHLGIDRGTFERSALTQLGDEDQNKRLLGKLTTAEEIIGRREAKGEKLGFSVSDLPGEKTGSFGLILFLLVSSALVSAVTLGALERSWRVGVKVLTFGLILSFLSTGVIAAMAPKVLTVKTINLSDSEVTQYCSHPRLELFVDSNSPHPIEKFGCTICHAGQGSATDFNLANHTPSNSVEEDKWKKQHGYHPSHFWDFPMLSKRFVESSCLKCHHQVTDLTRDGVKQEAPKLVRGYELVREMGCYGCHEIHGVKGGRPVGPDMRLEPTPAMDYLSAAEQEKARTDPTNTPGSLRKVGPSLRRLSEKTSTEWIRQWILDPRGFRDDTRMPHFYNLTTNNKENLPEDQKNFPAAEVHAMGHYLMTESKAHLDPKGAKDSYRLALLGGPGPKVTLAEKGLTDLQKELVAGKLDDRAMKELIDVSKRFFDLALLSSPMKNKLINDTATRHRQIHDKLYETWRRIRDNEANGGDVAGLKSQIPVLASEMDSLTATLVLAAQPTLIGSKILDSEGKEVNLPGKDGDATRGRNLFTEKGCLACHAHQGTTQSQKSNDGKILNRAVRSEAIFGPELSRIADKVTSRAWLIQWLLNPNVYHPRTRMPITHLKVEDANDVATWLLSQKTGWKGPSTDPGEPTVKDYKDLARVYLAKAPGMTAEELETFMPSGNESLPGIPHERMANFGRDAEERRLEKGKVTIDDVKWYIGKKTIGRLGCYGCHDIPGFETAKPIGTGLNDWGKKDNERLAFEDAENFVKTHFNIVPQRVTRTEVENKVLSLWKQGASKLPDDARGKLDEWLGTPQPMSKVIPLAAQYSANGKVGDAAVLSEEIGKLLIAAKNNLPGKTQRELRRAYEQFEVQEEIHKLEEKELSEGLSGADRARMEKLLPLKFFESVKGAGGHNLPPMEESFYRAIEHHHRQGFLQLKLAEPRSFDYNRRVKWDDRLRMPQFKFARTRQLPNESDEAFKARAEKEEAEAREAVMTFVLGLVAEPVPLKYVHNPKPEKQAEILGRQVLDKYNCGGCHQIRSGMYEFKMTDAIQANLMQAFSTYLENDKAIDHVFLNHNAWFGTPPTSDKLTAFGYLETGDSEAIRLTDALRFYGPDRAMYDLPAGSSFAVPPGSYTANKPYGGTWSNLMINYLMKKDSATFADRSKAQAALPPPLVREGERVQPDWLYQFLLNPHVIRPENYIILRMPKFNMSPEESRAIVNYFAAVSKLTNTGAGITAPYVNIDQRDPEYWNRVSTQYEKDVQRYLAEAKKNVDGVEALKKQIGETKDEKKVAQLKQLLATKEKELPGWQARVTLIEEYLKRKDSYPKNSSVRDLYSREAFKMLPTKELCLQCHSVGNIQSEKPQGPNLTLAANRLRPEWVEQWIAHPKRMFANAPVMPQNYKNIADPLKWEHQKLFVGSPIQQTRAVRDLLMDLPRLKELIATEKPPTNTGGPKK